MSKGTKNKYRNIMGKDKTVKVILSMQLCEKWKIVRHVFNNLMD